jgi:hypothetical protein
MQRKRIIIMHAHTSLWQRRPNELIHILPIPPSCSSPASPYLAMAGHGGDFSHAWILVLVLVLVLVGIMIGTSSATCQTTGACPHVRMAAAAPQSSAGGS